jgi:hypothetical protein
MVVTGAVPLEYVVSLPWASKVTLQLVQLPAPAPVFFRVVTFDPEVVTSPDSSAAEITPESALVTPVKDVARVVVPLTLSAPVMPSPVVDISKTFAEEADQPQLFAPICQNPEFGLLSKKKAGDPADPT